MIDNSWVPDGTKVFESEVARLSDADLAAPCLLPGWRRAHVVGHVARNADALGNLLTWARTGVETPMYASREQRDGDIDASAAQPPGELRDDLAAADRRLAEAIAGMPEDAWRATVRTAQGREVPARQVLWLRTREVWLHAVDLGGAATMADLPPKLVDALLDDVTAALAGPPPVLLAPADRSATWRLGPDHDAAVRVEGPASDLLGWVIGRDPGATRADGPLPPLPRWL